MTWHYPYLPEIVVQRAMGFGWAISSNIATKLLNHTTGAIQGGAAVYRAEFLPERKRALEAWVAHVLACAAGRDVAGNVMALDATRWA